MLNDTSKLEALIKSLKSVPFAKLGILGSKTYRTGATTDIKTKQVQGLSNADIGLIHEFGSALKNIPERSFLRMPLHEHFKEAAEKSKKLKNTFEKASTEGDLYEAMKLVGIIGENVVDEAFTSSGWGKWDPTGREVKHALEHPEKDKHPKPLIDTGQLRRSIMSEVVK